MRSIWVGFILATHLLGFAAQAGDCPKSRLVGLIQDSTDLLSEQDPIVGLGQRLDHLFLDQFVPNESPQARDRRTHTHQGLRDRLLAAARAALRRDRTSWRERHLIERLATITMSAPPILGTSSVNQGFHFSDPLILSYSSLDRAIGRHLESLAGDGSLQRPGTMLDTRLAHYFEPITIWRSYGVVSGNMSESRHTAVSGMILIHEPSLFLAIDGAWNSRFKRYWLLRLADQNVPQFFTQNAPRPPRNRTEAISLRRRLANARYALSNRLVQGVELIEEPLHQTDRPAVGAGTHYRDGSSPFIPGTLATFRFAEYYVGWHRSRSEANDASLYQFQATVESSRPLILRMDDPAAGRSYRITVSEEKAVEFVSSP